MTKLRVLDLFSGIGGFSLGLERTGGFETVAFCEIEPYPRRVLARHWPGVPCYEDVRTLTGARLAADGIAVDVICGGFPCQDLSLAGDLGGIDGERSGLWSEIARLVGELRPRFVIVENVANLLSGPAEQPGRWFGRVLGDLAKLGYDAEWENIPAAAVGAPHRRERVWLISYPSGFGLEANPANRILCVEACRPWIDGHFGSMGLSRAWSGSRPLGARPFSVGNGVSEELGEIKGYGNAVVPQIPELIGRAILAAQEAA